MTKANPPQSTTNPMQLNLVNSNRLQLLRKQAMTSESGQIQQSASIGPSNANPEDDAESIHLRNQVNQRLAEILTKLPAGKQRSLFKIRFGVELEKLEQMPVKQAAAILKIRLNRR